MKIFNSTYKVQKGQQKLMSVVICLFLFTFLFSKNVMAQEKIQMVRLAKIKVDPSQLDKFNAALKEQMTTAVRVEQGVLTYYAVTDKSAPSHITILEIYG